MNVFSRILLPLLIVACNLLVVSPAFAQRDYFTPEEVELIRDAQQIDERIAVLTYAVDRRFAALKIDSGGPKIAPKDSEKWGAFPTGTRGELLRDLNRILQKAVDDIDSLHARPDSMVINPEQDPKKKGTYDKLFPKAMRSLAKAAERFKPALEAQVPATKDNAELGSLLSSIELCDQILEAVTKLK